MPDAPRKPLIPSRVFIIGEGGIPRQELEGIEDAHLKAFLREPDPCRWPKAIVHLAKFLPREERTRWDLRQVLARHDAYLRDCLEPWLGRVWKEILQDEQLTLEKPDHILDELGAFLRERIGQWALGGPGQTPKSG